jgi:hypothetical protein
VIRDFEEMATDLRIGERFFDFARGELNQVGEEGGERDEMNGVLSGDSGGVFIEEFDLNRFRSSGTWVRARL